MECPVCYENSVNCTLVCGHKFCKSCVKTWYMRGGSCPMCRRKVHYRRMPIKEWRVEAEYTKKETVFEECFDEILETVMEPLVVDIEEGKRLVFDETKYSAVINGNTTILHRKNVSTRDLDDLQRTFRAIRDDATPDEIEYVLADSYDYYSDRRIHLNNRTYSEIGHWYPHQKHRGDPLRNKKSYLRK